MSTSTAHGVIRASSALWMLILVIGVFVQLSTELPMFYYAHTTEMRVFAFLSATVGLLLRPKDNPRLVIFYVICNAITFASMWTGAVEVWEQINTCDKIESSANLKHWRAYVDGLLEHTKDPTAIASAIVSGNLPVPPNAKLTTRLNQLCLGLLHDSAAVVTLLRVLMGLEIAVTCLDTLSNIALATFFLWPYANTMQKARRMVDDTILQGIVINDATAMAEFARARETLLPSRKKES